jgi:hypothetical protein
VETEQRKLQLNLFDKINKTKPIPIDVKLESQLKQVMFNTFTKKHVKSLSLLTPILENLENPRERKPLLRNIQIR